MSAISSANKISHRARIYIGQKLMIPVPEGHKLPETNFSSGGRSRMEAADGIYVVRRGDSLWEIANGFGTSVEELKRLNQLNGRNPKVYPGDRIRVSAAGNKLGDELIHFVKKGESLWSIAKMYKTTISEIRRWNNLPLNKFIFPGDRLKLYPSN